MINDPNSKRIVNAMILITSKKCVGSVTIVLGKDARLIMTILPFLRNVDLDCGAEEEIVYLGIWMIVMIEEHVAT